MESDPTRMFELPLRSPGMNVLGVVDVVDEMLPVHVETRVSRAGCGRCGVVARVNELDHRPGSTHRDNETDEHQANVCAR